MVAAFVRNLRLSKLDYTRQMFTFSDGGEVGLDWVHGDSKEETPIVLILPGIIIRVARPTTQNMYHQKKYCLAKINGGCRKGNFSKKCFKEG